MLKIEPCLPGLDVVDLVNICCQCCKPPCTELGDSMIIMEAAPGLQFLVMFILFLSTPHI